MVYTNKANYYKGDNVRKFVYGIMLVFVLFITGCADAGKDQSVISSEVVTLDGSASEVDFHGEIKKYRWKQIEGKKVKLSDKKTVKPSFTAPLVGEEKTLVFRLTTVEKGGYYSPWRTHDEVSIIVKPSTSSNIPPNAIANVDTSSIKYGESITFDANSSTDSDGQIVGFHWKDENNVTLSSEARFIHTFATTGTHTITLTVTDDGGLGAIDSVTIIVQELQKPLAVINSSTDTVIIGETILFDANSSTDADGQIVSYQWLDETNTTLSDQKSFPYVFTTSGEHNITLVVMDDDGQEARAQTNIAVEALLLSVSLEADTFTLEVNETTSLTATAHYNDDTTQDVSSSAVWLVTDESIFTVDVNGTLKALKSGTATVKAQVGELESNALSIEVIDPVVLQSISVSPNPINLRIGQSVQVSIQGLYSDGTTQPIDEGLDYTLGNYDVVSVDGTGTLEGLQEGSTTFSANVENIVSPTVNVTIGKELNTTNFDFTDFGSTYIDQIPIDATVDSYDEKRFCMITGQILTEDGSPLQGVKVSIHKHNEYGSTLTDSNGTYIIPSEGGLQLTMRYTKEGYTTIDRNIQAPVQDWVKAPDVTMLEIDTKVTQIDLNNATAQMHVSTPISDDRGERSTTLLFDGVTKATVTAPDGSTRELTNLNVRATEFKTPESMPSDLPIETAYTYCSDLQVDGVSDNDEVSFDAPVVMYVDNFLGFDVGEIVPVGYYDRNAGEWKASDNGVVIKLLDTDSDGVIDALDSTGDDTPNDLDGDGSFEDEVAGLQNNPDYTADKSYWRAEMMHFTPWDHNWPYGPPVDAEEPKQDDPKTDDDEPNDCKVNVSSYVTGKSRVFHEDIPVAGTDITLHYSSKRVEGYKYIIDASVDTTDLSSSIVGAKVTLIVAGKTYTKEPDLTELDNLNFVWDGKDALGNRVTGEVTATIKVAYKYQLVYLRASSAFGQAWARAGGASTNVIGREAVEFVNSKSIKLNVASGKERNSYMANGWTLSNIHSLGTKAVYKGDGTKVEKEMSLIDGLLAYYRFEGDATDSSFNGLNGIEVGNISYVDGVIGKAIKLDGTSRINLESFSDEDIAKGLTYSYWFKKLTNRYEVVFSQYTWHTYGHVFANRIGDTSIGEAYYRDLRGTTADGVSTSFSNDFGWHHVVVNSTLDTLQMWVDGKLTNETIKSGEPYVTNSSIQTYIGDTGPMGDGVDKHFRGELDDFRVYNKALSIEEIHNIYEYGNGGVTTYSFDTLNISDNSLEYQFNLEGKHLSTKAYPSHTSLETYTYDSNGHVETITNQFGEITTITRDINGNPTQITAPNGQVTTLTVDEQGNLTEVSYEDNSKYAFTYFDGSLMDIMTDPNGNQVKHLFNNIGRIVEEIDGEGGSYRFVRVSNSDDTFYSTIQPEGETQTSRDVILANGDTSSTITLPTGETVTATFAKDESSTTSTRDGVTTQNTYDLDTQTNQRRLASKTVTQPGGLKTTTTYATSYDGNETHTNSKTQTITSNNKTTTIATDYNNGTDTITTPTGRIATSTYNVDTLLTSSIQSGILTPTTYAYDDKGRTTKEATGTRETNYTYDNKGNVATITDPRGKITTFSYDVMDRVTTVNYPDGTQEQFSYDFNGNLLTRVVPTPADHDFTYNGVDSRTSYTSPLNKATTYTYDKNRRVTAISRPSGATITNTYDKSRLVSTTTPEGTTTYSYLFADKVGSISQGSESFTYSYDGELLTGTTQSGVLNQSMGYIYNNDFQVTSTTYAGSTENYTYDNDGLLISSGSYTLTRDAQNTYTTQVTDGTLTQNRSYNGFGEVTELSDNTFTYQLSQRDDAGAIVQKKETLNGMTVTYDYIFDEMGRLIEVKKDNTVVEEYTYDNNGNRASATANGTSTTASYTLDDQLEVYGDNTYRYDDDGYLTEKVTPDGTTTYTYGTLGELREVVTPAKTIEYLHNANNQRVAKKVNGTITEKYLWANLTTLLAVYDGSDTLVQRFEYADQRMPLSMTSNGTKYYLHYDQVGSLRAVTDSSHNIVKEIVYDTYGNIVTDSNPTFNVSFGFAGGLYDEDTKLTRFGYRDYDAYTGKWTAKDPIGFQGGDSNLYGYVLGDPVNFVDPDGLMTMRVPTTMIPKPKPLPKGYRPWVPKKSIPKGKNGEHKPDCDFPHTQLGTKSGRKGDYPQTKEWGGKGDRGYDNNTPKDLKDWTNHGRPGNHSDPHRHPYNPSTGKKGPAQPVYPPDMI